MCFVNLSNNVCKISRTEFSIDQIVGLRYFPEPLCDAVFYLTFKQKPFLLRKNNKYSSSFVRKRNKRLNKYFESFIINQYYQPDIYQSGTPAMIFLM